MFQLQSPSTIADLWVKFLLHSRPDISKAVVAAYLTKDPCDQLGKIPSTTELYSPQVLDRNNMPVKIINLRVLLYPLIEFGLLEPLQIVRD
jgi:hypothetical protein